MVSKTEEIMMTTTQVEKLKSFTGDDKVKAALRKYVNKETEYVTEGLSYSWNPETKQVKIYDPMMTSATTFALSGDIEECDVWGELSDTKSQAIEFALGLQGFKFLSERYIDIPKERILKGKIKTFDKLVEKYKNEYCAIRIETKRTGEYRNSVCSFTLENTLSACLEHLESDLILSVVENKTNKVIYTMSLENDEIVVDLSGNVKREAGVRIDTQNSNSNTTIFTTQRGIEFVISMDDSLKEPTINISVRGAGIKKDRHFDEDGVFIGSIFLNQTNDIETVVYETDKNEKIRIKHNDLIQGTYVTQQLEHKYTPETGELIVMCPQKEDKLILHLQKGLDEVDAWERAIDFFSGDIDEFMEKYKYQCISDWTVELGDKTPNLSISEFNERYGVDYQGEFEINAFTDYIKTEDLSYFYVSMCLQDILNICVEEPNVPIREIICVENWYLALR